MPQLNTVSAASLGGAGQSEVVITGGGSVFPTLRARNLGVNAPNKSNNLNGVFFEGFSGGGDSIQLPADDTAVIIYRLADQTTSFTKTLAQVNTALSSSITSWTGWRLNNAGTLLEGVGFDAATTPDTFTRFTINSSGTVVQVGSNDQPSSDFSTIPTWITSGSSIQVNEATGDLTILNGAGQIAVLNSSGQFTTDPTNPTNAVASQLYNYKTLAGDYVSAFDDTGANVGMMTFRLVTSLGSTYTIEIPKSTGIPFSSSSAKILEWKGYLVPFDGSVLGGALALDISTFSTFITNTKRALGIL